MSRTQPPFSAGDLVKLAHHARSIPAYGGKPFVGHDSVLRVAEVRGKGTKRSPWQILARKVDHDVPGHGWFLDPDVLQPA